MSYFARVTTPPPALSLPASGAPAKKYCFSPLGFTIHLVFLFVHLAVLINFFPQFIHNDPVTSIWVFRAPLGTLVHVFLSIVSTQFTAWGLIKGSERVKSVLWIVPVASSSWYYYEASKVNWHTSITIVYAGYHWITWILLLVREAGWTCGYLLPHYRSSY